MRKHWLIAILLLTSCAPQTSEATKVPQAILTNRPVATLPVLQPTPTAKRTDVIVRTAEPGWLVLASKMRGKVQRAINEKLWEDVKFKEDAYTISKQMIQISEGTVKEDSAEVLKRFRWGIEFMDEGQLYEVIKILDQYN